MSANLTASIRKALGVRAKRQSPKATSPGVSGQLGLFKAGTPMRPVQEAPITMNDAIELPGICPLCNPPFTTLRTIMTVGGGRSRFALVFPGRHQGCEDTPALRDQPTLARRNTACSSEISGSVR